MSDLNFPQYRKLSNEKSHYEIRNERHFIEKQIIGKQVFTIVIDARKYPEILRIQDMLACKDEFLPSSKEAFEFVGSQNSAPEQS